MEGLRDPLRKRNQRRGRAGRQILLANQLSCFNFIKTSSKCDTPSPVHYEYDWSDSSTASEIQSGDSDDSNYRPGQDISKKGRGAKKRKVY